MCNYTANVASLDFRVHLLATLVRSEVSHVFFLMKSVQVDFLNLVDFRSSHWSRCITKSLFTCSKPCPSTNEKQFESSMNLELWSPHDACLHLYVQSDFLNLTDAVTECDLLAARLENFILKTKGDLVLKLADFGLAKLMEEPKEPTSRLDRPLRVRPDFHLTIELVHNPNLTQISQFYSFPHISDN